MRAAGDAGQTARRGWWPLRSRAHTPAADAAPLVVVAQWESTFELTAPVVRALRARGVPVVIAVTPEPDDDGGLLVDECAALHAWLVEGGWDPLPLVDPVDEVARLRALEPCAVILPTPYDFHRHPALAADAIGLPLHDVSYFHRVAPDSVGGGESTTAFYDSCEAVYCGSQWELDQFIDTGLDPRIPVLTGHPGLDRWDADWEPAPEPTVMWCPWHIRTFLTGERGYCTFIEARHDMLEAMRARPWMHFIVRPHPLMFNDIAYEWTQDDEREFREAIAALPNVSFIDPANGSPEEQIGQSWAMITDGLSFIVDFAYLGRPMLLTEAPGHPGWSPNGEAIRSVVDTALVEDGVPGLDAFLDGVALGVDPEAVRAQREAVRQILHRPPGGAAAAVADHIEQVRARELVRRSARSRRVPPVSAAELRGLESLSQFTGAARDYQVRLLASGTLPWNGREVRAEVLASPCARPNFELLLEDGTALLIGPVWEGHPLTGLVRAGTVYDLGGRVVGSAVDVLGAPAARRIATGSILGGPRSVVLGTGVPWIDLRNQLPALCEHEEQIAALAASGEVRVRASRMYRGPLEALGGVEGLLPALAPVVTEWGREWRPTGFVPLAGARVTSEVRRRVRRVLDPVARAEKPRLWVGLSGSAEDPVNAPSVVADLALAWEGLGGGRVFVDTVAPDQRMRRQPWQADRIAEAQMRRAECTAAADARGARIDVEPDLGLTESLRRLMSSDAALVCSSDMTSAAMWLGALPTVVILAADQDAASLLPWYAAQADEAPTAEAVPAELLVADGDRSAFADGCGPVLAEQLMRLIRPDH